MCNCAQQRMLSANQSTTFRQGWLKRSCRHQRFHRLRTWTVWSTVCPRKFTRCLRVRWAINFGVYTRPAQWRCFKFHQMKCTQLSRSLQTIWHVANCPKQFKHANDQSTGPLSNLEIVFWSGCYHHRCTPLKLIRFMTTVSPTPQKTGLPFHQSSSFKFLLLRSLLKHLNLCLSSYARWFQTALLGCLTTTPPPQELCGTPMITKVKPSKFALKTKK